ncbi:MAG: hypothetical protein V4539_18135 [Bacteroidota bacterium]
MVQFKSTTYKNVVNLGFGDQLPDGRIDDKSVSNNGDTNKVIATVIQIAHDFTTQFPHLKIAFTGSTPGRNRMYNRVLKMYYKEFSKEFVITAFVEKRETMFEVDFDPDFSGNYLVFFVRRKT